MHTAKLRKVGGSIMLALPPAILDMLRLQAGSTVGLAVTGEQLVIEPRPRPHYTVEELLAVSDYSVPQPPEEREWIDAPAIGHEPI
jgi:antitoxin ChpS